MSDYFESFIQLIERQPELFTEEDRQDLCHMRWSNDKDEIENEIIEWAKPRASIYGALTNLSIKKRLHGEGKIPPRKESEYQPLLENTIHRCLSKPDNQSKSSTRAKAK
ncbi:MAG: hypothetical protein QNJ70_23690 [Xenococcaceae cyanobacterium MO_207.B15]|nr:hypothetical protein [Xenococcaceae cyanobacterium MO_207.B15]